MTWARGLGLLLVAYLAMIGNTALRVFVTWPLPDLGLLVALYAGLTCRLRGGAQVALRDASALSMLGLGAAIGYSSDVVMGTPRGLRALGLAQLADSRARRCRCKSISSRLAPPPSQWTATGDHGCGTSRCT